MKKIQILLFISVATALASCRGNSMYYDEATSSIKSCTSQPITNIVIESEGALLNFELKPGRSASDFRLNGDNPDFNLSHVQPVGVTELKLKPNTVYKIINMTDGGSYLSNIKLRTDGSGKIQGASKTDCD